ncbi:DUF1887 family CARF protein [Thermoanaerobacterium thermosaccharolyticum]|uniref:DUF1887 family CARF protein n=1 Tax=Thermoanaerobacterium thermosaccharolyticum TaxID=1517 RepID=UPI00104EA426|nr:DUF1887 family CARF protein [Thermoanaerobacterium thermosaccharolyticum]KAA5805724.1 DUF1887 domain-containing protein [Thermoanaerobacterium thermosaccharolyticum]TCW32477.1 hypothetical protein EDC21_1283 [Thermohydrogenium kirishiense]
MSKKALVLIVGTNPLPNYVVGSYLKDKYNEFVFICSEENYKINQYSTYAYAEKLMKHLNLKDNECSLPSLSSISYKNDIENELEDIFLDEDFKYFDEIHLNYTGGTKTMVVHIYNFLKDKFKDKFKGSYLDAKLNKLILDDGTTQEISNTFLDIKTLIDIHLYEESNHYTFGNYKYRKKSSDEKVFDEIFNEIKSEIEKGNGENIVSILKKQGNGSYIDDLYENFFKNRIKNPDEKKVKSVLTEMENGKEPFLSGGFWLEWYVYLQLREKIKNKNFKEGEQFGINLKAKKSNVNISNDFELDIFIINNNKLTGISITKGDNQGDCKLKGFEVIHRVKQIGGDESKAILITGLKKQYENDSQRGTKVLQNDLAYVTGTTEDKIVVFGIDDWSDIGSKICEEVFK